MQEVTAVYRLQPSMGSIKACISKPANLTFVFKLGSRNVGL